MQLVELDRNRVARAPVVVGGYTGRDELAVRHHIDELARIGVAPPMNVPEFYPVPAGAVTFAAEVDVDTQHTSGEVEPVLLRLGGELYLTLGSDHTDRKAEADVGVAESKQRCPKPLSGQGLRCTAAELDTAWDEVRLSAHVDGRSYQAGHCAALRPLTETLCLYTERTGGTEDDLVLFGGTVPLLGHEFSYGEHWQMTLETTAHQLELTYSTRVRTTEGAIHGQG